MPDAPASRPPRAAGCLLAAAVLAGAFVGARLGQPSLGLVIGLALGATVALAAWLADRRR